MEELAIRQLFPEDRMLLNEFYDTMGPESRFFINRREGNRRWTDRYFAGQEPNTRFFLAEDSGKMVGLVFLWDLDTGVPWLGIAVRDGYKGKHLGRRLLAFAQHYAEEEGKGGILLTTSPVNIRGQSLYENMGFSLLGNCFSGSGELLYLWRVPAVIKDNEQQTEKKA